MAAPRVDIYNDRLPAPVKMGKRVQFMIQNTALKSLTLPAPKRMRPLNSYMTFRSYYHNMFRDPQQPQEKDKSPFVATIWADDPFKPKWSMLAKVYSIIRDNCGGPKERPLSRFLEITCPYMGIIPPDQYLNKLNWHMTITQGKRSLVQLSPPDLSRFEDHYKLSNLSESDIIAICINHKYIPPATDIFKNMDDKGQRLMVSLPHFNPTPAKVTFIQDASRDPIAVAAQMFDLPIDHQFFNVSAPDMVWTGRMTDIYNPDDTHTMFGAGMDNEFFDTFNLFNPAHTTNYMNHLEHSLPPIQPELHGAGERYAVEDSF